jgi:transcriptional regulator with XRE-family HTH domain
VAARNRLAKAVRVARKARGFSQEKAAADCGLDARYFQRIEAGELNVTLVTLVKLSDGLGVDVAQLFATQQ